MFLLFQTPLPDPGGDFRCNPFLPRSQGVLNQIPKSLDGIHAILPLAAGFLRHDPENALIVDAAPKVMEDPVPIRFGETWRMSDVEQKLDPGFDLVHVLAPAAPAARKSVAQFGGRYAQVLVDDYIAIHELRILTPKETYEITDSLANRSAPVNPAK